MNNFNTSYRPFVVVLSGLFLFLMLLTYYQPSDYLPQQQYRQVSPYKTAKDTLDKVLVIAENWQLAPENPVLPAAKPAILEFLWLKKIKTNPKPTPTPTPTIPKENPVLPTAKPTILEFLWLKKIKTNPKPTPTPTPTIPKKEEPKTAQNWSIHIPNYMYPYLLGGLILCLIYGLGRAVYKSLQQNVAKGIGKMPIGIRPKKYAIAANFQRATIDPRWLKEIGRIEVSYAEANRPNMIVADDLGDLPLVLSELPPTRPEPKVTMLEKMLVAPLRWVAPNIKRLQDFRFKFVWKDFWALLASIFQSFPFILYLKDKDDWVTLIISLLPLLAVVQSGLFRRSKLFFWVLGIGSIVLVSFGLIGFAIYLYILEHPEALVAAPIDTRIYQWLGAIAVIGTVWWLWLQTSWGKVFRTKKMTEKIWLKDHAFGANFVYSIIGIVIISLFDMHQLFSVFLVGIFINLLLFFISPLEKGGKDKQWTVSPKLAVNLIFIGVFGLFYLWIFDVRTSNFYWFIYGSLAFHFGCYLFGFPHIGTFKDSPKEKGEVAKKEKKKAIQKIFQNPIKSVQKVVQKEIPMVPSPKTEEVLNWWKLENPEQVGMLNLSKHGLQDNTENIDKLLAFKNLYQLYLNDNHLDTIPDEVFWLHNLRKLDLNNNNIAHLPSKLTILKDLAILELANNDIKSIPPWVLTMPSLKILNLKGNPLSEGQIKQLKKEAPHLELEF